MTPDPAVACAWLCVIATGVVVAALFWTPVRRLAAWIVGAIGELHRKSGGRG